MFNVFRNSLLYLIKITKSGGEHHYSKHYKLLHIVVYTPHTVEKENIGANFRAISCNIQWLSLICRLKLKR